MDVEQRVSRVPLHLRQFHHSSPTKEPVRLNKQTDGHPYRAEESCPPRWSLSGRWRGLISVLEPRNRNEKMSGRDEYSRPSIGRMKDSDDYITARAANPWTGLISPSPGIQTPCSSTPNSPGDALNLRRRTTQQETPTHAMRKRPKLAKANEGRKVSGGSGREANMGHEYENTTHSPGRGKEQDSGPRVVLQEDQFVVHMPSAREPQPFAYPGYTAEQIEALEHYRCKARRVSSEGYDRRLFHDKPVAVVDSEHMEAHSGRSRDLVDQHHRPFHPYTAERYHSEPTAPEPARLMVRKRENSKVSRILHHSQPRVDAQQPSQGPSPRSPKMSTIQRPVVHPNVPSGTRNLNKHAEKCSATVVGSGPKLYTVKPIGDSSPSRRSSIDDVDQYIGRRSLSDERSAGRMMPGAFTDLSQLPRVRLVKPEHAAVPRNNITEGRRQCSLGCGRQDGEEGGCTQRRVNSTGTVVHFAPPLFEKTTDEVAKTNHTEQLLDYILMSVNYLGSLQLPKVGLFELLRDPEVSTKEKAEALKAILSLAGHALAICTLLAMLWKLATSLVHFFEVVLWPLAVPLRLMKWVLIS